MTDKDCGIYEIKPDMSSEQAYDELILLYKENNILREERRKLLEKVRSYSREISVLEESVERLKEVYKVLGAIHQGGKNLWLITGPRFGAYAVTYDEETKSLSIQKIEIEFGSKGGKDD